MNNLQNHFAGSCNISIYNSINIIRDLFTIKTLKSFMVLL